MTPLCLCGLIAPACQSLILYINIITLGNSYILQETITQFGKTICRHRITSLTARTMETYNSTNSSNNYLGSAVQTRDMLVNITSSIIGVLAILFNGFMIACLYLFAQRRTRKHITFMMVQMFFFCMLSGFVNTFGFSLFLRHLRYDIPTWWCVINSMVIYFFDGYILLMLPLLVIERFLSIKYPYITNRKLRIYCAAGSAVSVLVVGAAYLLPRAEFMQTPEKTFHFGTTMEKLKSSSKFYRAFSCQLNLRMFNMVSPAILLILDVFCLLTVVGLYIRMYCIAKTRATQFSSMTQTQQKRMKRAAINVLLVSVVFCITTIPYGLITSIRSMCKTGHKLPGICGGEALNLWFTFKLMANLSNFLAPLLFTIFSPPLRTMIRQLLSHLLHKIHPAADGSSRETSNQKAPSAHSTSSDSNEGNPRPEA